MGNVQRAPGPLRQAAPASGRHAARLAVLTFGLLLAGATGAQQSDRLLLHLPLDGSLETRGSLAVAARYVVREGGARPSFVAGRIGQALALTDVAAVAVPLVLDHADYPQLTVTAWVREPADETGARDIVSAGSTAGLAVGIHGGRLAARLGDRGVSFALADLPPERWVFVAAVLDTANGWARLHQQDQQSLHEGLDVSTRPPRSFADPDDAAAEPRPYTFVGANQIRTWSRAERALSVDDVRIYAGALSYAEVESIRQSALELAGTAPAGAAPPGGIGDGCASHGDCPAGSYCAIELVCHPDRHAPLGTVAAADAGAATPAGVGSLDAAAPGRDTGVGSPGLTGPATSPAGELAGAVEAATSSTPTRSSGDVSTGGATGGDTAGNPGDIVPDETLEQVSANRPPELAYDSEEEAEAAAEERRRRAEEAAERNRQMPSQVIDATFDLQRLGVARQLERRGDEYYLVTYELRGFRGTGDRIYTFDADERIWPLQTGDNWAQAGEWFSIPQGAGRLTFEDLQPFEVYGFVAVVMEANANTHEERGYAFGFGEFQNEAGVTEVVSSAFERAVPRTGETPDYGDRRCENVRRVYDLNRRGLLSHFDDDRVTGLPQAIESAISVPLERGNPDRLEGVFWAFGMNLPGRNPDNPQYNDCVANIRLPMWPVGYPLRFETRNLRFEGEHR